nr:arginine--tRNA ligase [Candidatus Levybacteria bacterium]
MENPKEKIYSILQSVASDLGVGDVEFKVEQPKDESHGDFASNIALAIFSDVKNQKSKIKNPMELAEEIVSILNTKYKILDSDFDKVEIAKPGFINFYLSNKYLQNQVQNIILQGETFGSSSIGKNKTASVEFVSANPTGPLHIGNARGGPLGDTIANVLTKVGYQVVREYLHNDVGGQVERLGEAIYFTIHPDQKPKDYEVQYQGDYIKELSQSVKESLEEKDLSQEEFIEKAGKIAVKLMLDEILKDCELMGIKFDKVSKESELRHKVPDALSKLQKFLKENDGALWFAPNDEFLKDRETVVRKSDGNYTYFASDIAYHNQKFEDKNDLVVDILGANHSGHVPRLQAVVKSLGFNTDNFKVILYQWIRLKRGDEIVKMSKRAGTFVTAKEVLDEVGKDAFRFFLLTPRTQTHMDFDLELAKKKSAENPVFYVQYAHTRISSIFSKIKNEELEMKNSDLSLLKAKEEVALIRKLLVFPYLVEEVANNFEVNGLTTYALELATTFHKFYEANQVITKDEKLTQARLALLKATQITLKNTLDLLGVSAPEKM